MNPMTSHQNCSPTHGHGFRVDSQRSSGVLLRSGFLLFGLSLGLRTEAGELPGARPDDTQNRAGYSAGYAFGDRLAELQRRGSVIELEAVFKGIVDALSGAEPRFSSEEMRAALQELEQKDLTERSEGDKPEKARIPARHRGYADDFAALNARRKGVVTLASGVQYEVLQAGDGRRPGPEDAVLVSYQGSLTNGAVFDSTYEDEQPARLELEEIAVPGLREALLLMNEGAKWRVVIPPGMGFKTSGNNMLRRRDLIYDIELVSIKPAKTPAPKTETAVTSDNEAPTAPIQKPSGPAAEQP